ncbi:hypothetical protein GQ457_03G021890 [Hibiscus cannabinus]
MLIGDFFMAAKGKEIGFKIHLLLNVKASRSYISRLDRTWNMSRCSAYEKKKKSKPPFETSFGTRTEKEDETSLNELVWTHQQIIEELVKENQKLHEIVMEDLKYHPSSFKLVT